MTTAAPASTTTSTILDPDVAVSTLVLAFSSDPVVRWFLPDGSRYLQHFPELLHLTAALAASGGGIDGIAGGAGASLWHAPGTHIPDEELATLLADSIDPDRLEQVFGFLERMGTWHPTSPHWYLPFIGVDPHHQGQGHGSHLLAHGLTRCDGDQLPAYLEASTPGNRRLYERHGFQVLAEIQVADSPPLWPMLRTPR